jgi:hypothetical protein
MSESASADFRSTSAEARVPRLIFAVAAIYGMAVLTPGLFIEATGVLAFVELSNPEFYYGFYGSALVWQLAFLLIAYDPVRYRPLMLVAVPEKAAFFAACLWLWQAGRLGAQSGPFIGAMIDGLLMLAFIAAWWLTPAQPKEVVS